MCNPEPTTLAEYCESVSANVMNNAVSMQGMTDVEAAHATPTAKDSMNQSLLDELQSVGSCAQVPTRSILAEADEITSVDRNKTYGPPRDNHVRTAQLWNAYISGKRGMPLNYRDVCWLNLLQKASRDVFCPGRDNVVDAAGYLRNIEMADNDEGR